MRKSIQNAIAQHYTFDHVKKVKGRYIGYFGPMRNGFTGGYQTPDPIDMGACDEYYWEKTSSGCHQVMRNGEKIFGFGP